MRNAIIAIAVLTLAITLAVGCTTQTPETELVPPSKDGMFYLSFADAQQAAAADGKLIMLEMWRPG